mmetsp:Transcript_17882/g.51890  ORF Transcript_17882/g.51890 Transcript_17882/m.51890 type:complete len:117 (+) Transcript_17882:294-644(+)
MLLKASRTRYLQYERMHLHYVSAMKTFLNCSLFVLLQQSEWINTYVENKIYTKFLIVAKMPNPTVSNKDCTVVIFLSAADRVGAVETGAIVGLVVRSVTLTVNLGPGKSFVGATYI